MKIRTAYGSRLLTEASAVTARKNVTAVLIVTERKWSRMSEDLIRRSDAIDALDCINGVEEVLKALPSADRPPKVVTQVTFDEEKLREIVKEAVEHFKEEYEIEPKRGEWIFKTIFPNDKSEFPMGYLECSVCGSHHRNATPCNYCDNCGADMRGGHNE